MPQPSHAAIPLLCLLLFSFKWWCLLVAVYDYSTCVFLQHVFKTCLCLYITISQVHIFKRCLCFRSLARMLNGKLWLFCKTNWISSSSNICRLQLFLSSKCTNRVPDSNMNIFTQSKFFPQAFAREQQINENGKLQSRTDCLQPKAERWNRNQPTRVQRLLPHANRVASLWCIHYSTFWYARCSTLSPFQSTCSKMLQLHKIDHHRTVKGTTSLLDDTVRYWTPAGHMHFSNVSLAILSYTLCVQKFWTIVTWMRKERVVLVAKNFDILQGSQKDFHCKNKADDEPSEIFMLTSSGSLTRICPCSPLLPCTLSPWKYTHSI